MTTTTDRATGGGGKAPFDPARIRRDFPIFAREFHGKPLVYLDSANTSQKPHQVLAAMDDYYRRHNANVHRAVYALAEEATFALEESRAKLARFVGASDRATVFTKNVLDLDAYDRLLSERTKLVAVSAMSNVLGTINPVPLIAERAHAVGALVLADAAQAVPHLGVTFDELGADFMGFTGHKLLGPMGIGVLVARPELLDSMEPFQTGGEMIRQVTIERATWNDIPWRFEAGTPNVGGAVGLAAAVDYLDAIGMDQVRAHESALTAYALERLAELDGLRLLGPGDVEQQGGVVSFTMAGVHPHDVAQVLDAEGIAVRAGDHCAMPLHTRFGLAASTRVSFSVYSTTDEVDALVTALDKTQRLFA